MANHTSTITYGVYAYLLLLLCSQTAHHWNLSMAMNVFTMMEYVAFI